MRIALVALAITSCAPSASASCVHAPDARDRAVGGRGRDAAVAADVVAEAQHLLLAGDGFEGAVGMHVGDEQVERVRAEVERRDAHVGSSDTAPGSAPDAVVRSASAASDDAET